MTDVFLSYSSRDRDRVKSLVEELQKLDLDVWWDRDISGGSQFDREIETAIDSAKCVVVVWSDNSINSDWVRTEATEGMDRNILLPVLIDDCRPPLAFRRTQTAQLLGWPESRNHDELNRFLASVRMVVKVPGGLPEDLDGSSGKRTITHMTARIIGLDRLDESLGLEETEALIERVRTASSRIITHNGGTINQFSGATINAMFGLPMTHEDDPVRAILAATELNAVMSDRVEGWQQHNLAFAIGVASGEVIAKLRNDKEGKYSLTGACIELSSELAFQFEKPSVLVCERTQRRVPGFFEMERHEKLVIRGRAKPVTGFLVLSRTNVYTRFEAAELQGLSDFSGREVEMALLAQIKSQVMMGLGQVVSVVGEAGTGKSRLLQEFQRSLDEEETVILTGQCQSTGIETAYLPFIDVIQEAFVMEGVPAASLEEYVVGKIRQLNPELEPYIPHCLHILSIPSQKFALPGQLDAESRKLALQDSLVALLTAATQLQTTVLILEDWHWADEASTQVLQKLIDVSSAYSFLLIVSHRPDYEAGWSHLLNCSQVKIPPLNPVACVAIMQSVIGARVIPESFSQRVFDKTGGNPFFIEEICKSLEEDGVISVVDDELILHRNPDELNLPDTVQAVIRTRLDQLDPVSHQVLCAASIIGREFNLSLLEAIQGSDASLRMVLGMLSAAGLIAQIKTLPEPIYMFRHVLTQTVAYDSLLIKHRRAIHEETGTAIENLYSSRLDEFLERLVYHFVNSQNDTKAIDYSIRAGKKATSQAACNEAVSHFSRALELLERQHDSDEIVLQKFEIYLELAQQLILTDGYASERVIHAFDTARELNKQVGDPLRFFPTLWGLWRVYYVRALYDEALELSAELLEIAESTGDSNYLSAAHTARSVSYYWLGRLPDQIRHSDLAIELMDLAYENLYGYRHSIQPGVMNLCFRQSAEFAMGLHEDARKTRDWLKQITAEVKHPPSKIFSLFYQGVSYTFDHQPVPANKLFTEVMEIAQREHFPYLVSLAKFHQARLLVYEGKFDESMAGMKIHQQALEKLGLKVTTGLYHLICAALCQQQGLIDQGLEHIEQAMGTLPYLDADIHRVKGDLLAAEHPEEAIEWYERAVTISRKQGARFFEMKACCGLAMLQVKLGNPEPAKTQLQEICDWFPSDNTAPELLAARQFLARTIEETGQ